MGAEQFKSPRGTPIGIRHDKIQPGPPAIIWRELVGTQDTRKLEQALEQNIKLRGSRTERQNLEAGSINLINGARDRLSLLYESTPIFADISNRLSSLVYRSCESKLRVHIDVLRPRLILKESNDYPTFEVRSAMLANTSAEGFTRSMQQEAKQFNFAYLNGEPMKAYHLQDLGRGLRVILKINTGDPALANYS